MQAITTESLLASVRSFVPGRLRLRHPALAELSDDLADGLVAWLKTKPGMTEVTLNPRVGSLLLLWDESQADWTFEDLAEERPGFSRSLRPRTNPSAGSTASVPSRPAKPAKTPGRFRLRVKKPSPRRKTPAVAAPAPP